MPRQEGQMQGSFLAVTATLICAILLTAMAGKLLGLKTVSKLSAMKALIVELGNNRTKLIEMLR